ncbi:MAG: hypothetical protein IT384_22935 [Deltaproteobacteria bacterium]|nr:hypothetical protein [Deltaproteobacteria bacterium]
MATTGASKTTAKKATTKKPAATSAAKKSTKSAKTTKTTKTTQVTKKAPLKSAAVSAAAKAEALKLVEVAGPKAQPVDGADLPSIFPLEALSEIKTHGPEGVAFRLDSGFLDALRMQVRRIETSSGDPGFQLDFKIAGPSRATFEDQLEKKGAKHETFAYVGAAPVKRKSQTILKQNTTRHEVGTSFYSHKDNELGSSPNQALQLKGKGWLLEYIPHGGPIAIRGAVRVRLTGSDQAAGEALKDLIQKTGLQPAFAPPTTTSVRRYALMKLLWQLAPDRAHKIASSSNLSSLKLETLDAELKKLGVSASRIQALRYEEVAPGHFTVLDPEVSKQAIKAGLRFAYSTVATPEHVHAILTGGQKATLTRWSEGQIIEGMSSMADLGSGGAQGVFSRLVTESAKDKYWTGRTYKIILRPELLDRLDIWGWPSDYYGRSWDLTDANFGAKLVKSVGSGTSYQTNNEIVSPVGNGTQFIAAVVATSEEDRKKLLTYLKKEGYQPPSGKKLESFVVVRQNIDVGLLSKVG